MKATDLRIKSNAQLCHSCVGRNPEKVYIIFLYLLRLIGLPFYSCLLLYIFGCNQNPKIIEICYYRENQISSYELAWRFAPRLYINDAEPYHIKDMVVIIHPQKPLISYHFIWEEDSIAPGFGFDSDHEIAWIEYDPVSLNVADVWALWHRGILHTDISVTDAKLNGQRPCFLVQWGQHGLLPLGWEKIPVARLDIELRTHYKIAKSEIYNKHNAFASSSSVRFQGSYSDYITFDKMIDTRGLIKSEEIAVAIDSRSVLSKILPYKVMLKQTWPY